MEELIRRQQRYTTVRGVLSFYISTTRLFYILSLICFLASEDHGVLSFYIQERLFYRLSVICFLASEDIKLKVSKQVSK